MKVHVYVFCFLFLNKKNTTESLRALFFVNINAAVFGPPHRYIPMHLQLSLFVIGATIEQL